MQHASSRTEISHSWPERLFQCSRTFGSRPRAMMSAHCVEVTHSIIHKRASFWVNILTDRFEVYSTAPVKAVFAVLLYTITNVLFFLCEHLHDKRWNIATCNLINHTYHNYQRPHQMISRVLVLIIEWLSQFQSFAGKQQQKGHQEAAHWANFYWL